MNANPHSIITHTTDETSEICIALVSDTCDKDKADDPLASIPLAD